MGGNIYVDKVEIDDQTELTEDVVENDTSTEKEGE
jgi:hypothetical protein